MDAPPTAGFDAVKSQIKATDEEWKVIGPKLRKVMTARRATELSTRTTGMGGFGGPGFGNDSFAGPGNFGPGRFGGPGGPGGFGALPQAGQVLAPFLQGLLSLTAEQKKQLETLQNEVNSKLAKVLTEAQSKQLKEPQPGFGPGGFAALPRPGQILSSAQQDRLSLSAEQKKQLETLQKEVDGQLGKLLTEPQNKQLKDMQQGLGRVGMGGPPGFAPGASPGPTPGAPSGPAPSGPPGFGEGGDSAVLQALTELQSALDDTSTTPAQLKERVAAVRLARQKARDKLVAAQKELLELLTPDQEAVLVRLGYLD
jgi:hypothetical protein